MKGCKLTDPILKSPWIETAESSGRSVSVHRNFEWITAHGEGEIISGRFGIVPGVAALSHSIHQSHVFFIYHIIQVYNNTDRIDTTLSSPPSLYATSELIKVPPVLKDQPEETNEDIIALKATRANLLLDKQSLYRINDNSTILDNS
ncbi:hypothetical protein PROFUN_07333 [Planoprotostelium fungivorum]|uniref:Uncharacterized protein n=1 Tax=Planoprotostelium fungivorum TaxID=1890364 RepID=A0A2P6NM07_9EUKA|nr:hypothetical protein PROFUN_07333 [Planoprotostelium fungivorum]